MIRETRQHFCNSSLEKLANHKKYRETCTQHFLYFWLRLTDHFSTLATVS